MIAYTVKERGEGQKAICCRPRPGIVAPVALSYTRTARLPIDYTSLLIEPTHYYNAYALIYYRVVLPLGVLGSGLSYQECHISNTCIQPHRICDFYYARDGWRCSG